MVRVAVRIPATVGVNETPIVQVAPPATERPRQGSLVLEKSEPAGPELGLSVSFRAPVRTLVMGIDMGALVVCNGWAGNVSTEADKPALAKLKGLNFWSA